MPWKYFCWRSYQAHEKYCIKLNTTFSYRNKPGKTLSILSQIKTLVHDLDAQVLINKMIWFCKLKQSTAIYANPLTRDGLFLQISDSFSECVTWIYKYKIFVAHFNVWLRRLEFLLSLNRVARIMRNVKVQRAVFFKAKMVLFPEMIFCLVFQLIQNKIFLSCYWLVTYSSGV